MRIQRGDVALVTGASRGIGRHIAIALAGRGMDLVVAARPTHLAAPFRTVADRRR